MKKNVLLLETLVDESLNVLQEHLNVFGGYNESTLKDVLQREEIHAIITRGKGQINKALISACPSLQVVARCGVGLDNVDVTEATARKIVVLNTPGANTTTVAEHTLSLMLMLMRNMYESVAQVKNDNWNWRNQYSGDELNGKTLGILGLGNIGKRVARLGEAFGMKVLYWSRSAQDVSYTWLPMKEVLKRSDVVSLHLPFISGTGALIGEEEFALMKPGSLLINTARGALIDHEALAKALKTEQISGFAADVISQDSMEPVRFIMHHPRSLITPHAASLTAATFRQMCLLTANNVVAVLSGKEPELKSIFNLNELTSKNSGK